MGVGVFLTRRKGQGINGDTCRDESNIRRLITIKNIITNLEKNEQYLYLTCIRCPVYPSLCYCINNDTI